jgi:Putative prokaryotic signal transducing protein
MVVWKCPRCEARVDDEWEVCWSCGTSIDGEEDPYFGAEDEEGEFEEEPGGAAEADPEPIHLVTVASFPVAWQAHVAKGRLEAEGIPCLLADEYVAAVFGLERFAWIKLQVTAEDAEAAHALLESWRTAGGEEGPTPPAAE